MDKFLGILLMIITLVLGGLLISTPLWVWLNDEDWKIGLFGTIPGLALTIIMILILTWDKKGKL